VTKPRFFQSPSEFREWLQENGEQARELLVGFNRVASGKGGLRYREALDEALCFGWIDGVRRWYDETSYSTRFTPRTAGSIWSAINTARMEELIKLGRCEATGRWVFEQRDRRKSKLYSYEVGGAKLSAEFARPFRAKTKAWEFYQAQAPWYRRVSGYWVMSAKKEETRRRRLEVLIADSASGRRIKQVVSDRKRRV